MHFSHNVFVPVCCLGVLRHSMMLSLWWDCLSSSLTSLDSPLSSRTRLSIYRNYTTHHTQLRITRPPPKKPTQYTSDGLKVTANNKSCLPLNVSILIHHNTTDTHMQRGSKYILLGYKAFMTMCCDLLHNTHTNTPDRAPQVDGRDSRICDAAPLLLSCSFVYNKTEAPQNPPRPPPTCYYCSVWQ